ncbi:MAG: MarR family transcriptional regulator [Sphingomonas sp.]
MITASQFGEASPHSIIQAVAVAIPRVHQAWRYQWGKMVDLSRLENHVLALIRKWQPTTAYFVRKSLDEALATNISNSPGSVYPAIERLKRHGLVTGQPSATGRRASEHLTCSPEGEDTVRDWLVRISPVDLLPEDPWRTRMGFADLLSAEELTTWLFDLKSALAAFTEKLDGIDAYPEGSTAALQLEHAKLASAARLGWINASMAALTFAQNRAAPAYDS